MFTTQGLELFAAWEADPTLKKPIKYIGLGSGEPTHTTDQISLNDQKYFGEITRIYSNAEDETIAVVEAIVNFETRDFTVREVGLYVEGETEETPILVWVSEHPEMYIPANSSMIAGEIISIPIQFNSADQVTLETTNGGLCTIEGMFEQLIGQAAVTAIREIETAEEIGRIKNYIFNN